MELLPAAGGSVGGPFNVPVGRAAEVLEEMKVFLRQHLSFRELDAYYAGARANHQNGFELDDPVSVGRYVNTRSRRLVTE